MRLIAPVYKIMEAGTQIGKTGRKKLSRDTNTLLKQRNKLEIEDGILVRKTNNFRQLVLPKVFHSLVYTELHEELVHLGSEKVLDLARKRFYWPRMQNHLEFYIKKLCRCLISKITNIPERAPLIPMESKFPFEMLQIDYLHLIGRREGMNMLW